MKHDMLFLNMSCWRTSAWRESVGFTQLPQQPPLYSTQSTAPAEHRPPTGSACPLLGKGCCWWPQILEFGCVRTGKGRRYGYVLAGRSGLTHNKLANLPLPFVSISHSRLLHVHLHC